MKEALLRTGRTALAAGMLIAPPIDKPGLSPTYEETIRAQTSTTQTVEQAEEVSRPESLKQLAERIDAFTWEDFDSDEKLQAFKRNLVSGYIEVTGSRKYVPFELDARTIFFRDAEEFVQSSEDINSQTDSSEQTVFLVNLDMEDGFLNRDKHHPGYFLLDSLWSAWMSEDAKVNDKRGVLLNQPDLSDLLDGELPDHYFGGGVYSQNNAALLEFHLSLSHAISARFIIEKLGIDILNNERYVEILRDFYPYTTLDIIDHTYGAEYKSVDDIYNDFTNSNLEKILRKIGKIIEYDGLDEEELREEGINPNLYKGLVFAFEIEIMSDQNIEEDQIPQTPNNTV